MKAKNSYIFFDKDTAFQGEISTDNLFLEGIITGEVRALKGVFLKRGSIVQGEIATRKYLVEEGSVHQGKLKMDRKNGNSQNNPAGSNATNGLKQEPVHNKPAEFEVTLPKENREEVFQKEPSTQRLW